MTTLNSFLWRTADYLQSRVQITDHHATLVALAIEASHRDTEYMVNVYASSPSRVEEFDYYRDAILALARNAKDYTGATAARILRDEDPARTILYDQMEAVLLKRKTEQADILGVFHQGDTRNRRRAMLASGEETRNWIGKSRSVSAPKFYIGTVPPPKELRALWILLWKKRDDGAEPLSMPDPLAVERSAAPLSGTVRQILAQIAKEAGRMWPSKLADALADQEPADESIDSGILFDVIAKFQGAPWLSTQVLADRLTTLRIGKVKVNRKTLALLFNPMGIRSSRFGRGGARGRGYLLSDLEDAAERMTGHRSRPVEPDPLDADDQEQQLADHEAEKIRAEADRFEQMRLEATAAVHAMAEKASAADEAAAAKRSAAAAEKAEWDARNEARARAAWDQRVAQPVAQNSGATGVA